jgi:hypothetical protein
MNFTSEFLWAWLFAVDCHEFVTSGKGCDINNFQGTVNSKIFNIWGAICGQPEHKELLTNLVAAVSDS